ncbi:MAG: NADH-quinone oxidoreductase subunit D [Planctomycetes bacterium]|nr:NADH-quinone oxidoreductase subunit D [Planctomycetota bacterium]
MSTTVEAAPSTRLTVRRLEERFGEAARYLHGFRGDDTVLIQKDRLLDVLGFLKSEADLDYDFLMDLAGADHLELPRDYPERYEVVYHLLSTRRGHRVRLRVRLDEDEVEAALKQKVGVVDSAAGLWRAADWMEREVYDLFGIRFRNHPMMKRILCHKDFVGHALRKDYPIKQGQWLAEPDDLLDEMGEADANADDLFSDLMELNLGPAHPAMHGTFRLLVRMDGETIRKAVPEVGYLHRAFEKSAEKGNYTQVIPYTDRLNYCSALVNNVAYCRAIEKLMGLEITERAITIRVILMELSRIIDHLVCVGANLVDMGALTNFWYSFGVREEIYEVLESLTGHRLTNNYVRIGGLAYDLYEGFEDHVRACLVKLRAALKDVLGLVRRNRIFIDRTKGVAVISREDAVSYGWTGPCLRSAGMDWDLRKKDPYYHYGEWDFEVPVLEGGDVHDRLLIRFLEMEQSVRIIEQALSRLPGGPVNVENPAAVLPQKPGRSGVYGNIESLMNHFVMVYQGVKPPAGEVYCPTEAPNGELGFYVISDGTGQPYRVRVRPPCFLIYSAYSRIIEGGMLADAVLAIGSLNIIAGELDR